MYCAAVQSVEKVGLGGAAPAYPSPAKRGRCRRTAAEGAILVVLTSEKDFFYKLDCRTFRTAVFLQ